MNEFITQNLTEEEIELILTRHAEVKRARFGRIETIIEDGKIVQVSRVYKEIPAILSTIYERH